MSKRLRRLLLGIAVVVAIAVLVLDIATGVWAQVPVLSGLASSFVMLLVTVVVVDKVIAHHQYRRWEPVTRIALADILHAITHDGASAPEPRLIGPRLAEAGAAGGGSATGADPADSGDIHLTRALRLARKERRVLGRALATWSAFLVSNAPVGRVVDHAATLADELDDVRASALAVRAVHVHGATGDASERDAALAALDAAVQRYDAGAVALVAELRATIDALGAEGPDDDDDDDDVGPLRARVSRRG